MSALIDAAVNELRSAKAQLTLAENESSRLFYEHQSADEQTALAQQRFDSARINVANAALAPE